MPLSRPSVSNGGGWVVLHRTGSLGWLFAALAVALVVYGLTLAAAVASGVWFRGVWRPGARRFRLRMLVRNEMPLNVADRKVEKAA
jgi:hypothetical protein